MIFHGLLYLSGKKAETLLQGTLTQEVRDLADDEVRYTGLVTPQGKLVADGWFQRFRDGFLLRVHPGAVLVVARHLHGYALEGGVEFEDVSGEVADSELLDLPIPDEAPEVFPMLALTKLYPAEIGLEALGGVSFHKGCYVGQEVVSRMKNKTSPKKRLYFAICEADLNLGDKVVTDTGSEAGLVLQTLEQGYLVLLGNRFLEKEVFVHGSALQEIRLPAYIGAD